MRVIYAQQPLQKSIFLAGPSPRKAKPGQRPTPSWRPHACVLLEKLKFDGLVFAPEPDDFMFVDEDFDRDVQVSWEWEALNQATVVVFWVPRNLETLPGFTTNVEFGNLVASGKVLLGCPPGAPKTEYLVQMARRYRLPVYHSLDDILAEAVRRTKCLFGMEDRPAVAAA